MAGFDNDYFAERERWSNQTRENSARRAWAYGTCSSTGWGEFVIPDPIMFGVTFTEMPIMAYGMSLDDDEQLVDNSFPRASGGVVRWIQDGRDFYVGAHVFITVATQDPILAAMSALALVTNPGSGDPFPTDPGYHLTHHFTFNGLAIKDMSP